MIGPTFKIQDQDRTVRPVGLHIDDDGNGGFTGSAVPRLSWRIEAERPDARQVAYQIETAADPAFTDQLSSSDWTDGSACVGVPWPGEPFSSRERRWLRVRLRTDAGVSCWSVPIWVEAALLRDEDWTALPISPRSNVERYEAGPVPLLRRGFRIDREILQARLYVTALGIQECWINGVRVGDALLEPGWSAYQSRHHYAAYDVTAHLRLGDNVLAVAVGDGWWRGWLTWMGKRAVYGSTTALVAQLEITFRDGTAATIATDGEWRGGSGAARMADMYDGVDIDLAAEPAGWKENGFDDSGWEAVDMLELPQGLGLRPMPPVRIVETLAVEPVATSSGTFMVDTGQNIVGYLHLRLRGRAGASVSVRHAEMLDDEGKLYTAPLRRAKATDRYVLASDDVVEIEPPFTFHGFRHAEITVDEGVEIIAVTACVIASDLRETATFECSDPRLNRLFSNVRWSLRGNFVSLPTDCPQRDERLGWTGDIQVFAETAVTLTDCGSFLTSWLADLAAEQRDDGNVPSTVPNVIGGFEYEYGGVGWGDAAVLVPWAIYQAYGDPTVLRDQFASMCAWVEYGASRTGPDGTWSGDFQLGDWLDPNAPAESPEKATTNGGFIATAYLSHSARTLAKAAAVLGHEQFEARYERLAQTAAAAAWKRWRHHAVTTQTGCAMALMFGIAPLDERADVVRALAELVRRSGGRIGTGFLGTPLVLPALAAGGEIEAAYELLMNERCPGWLYQVARGATTMWERWDAVQEDGSLHAGEMAVAEDASMISFNHYAYGAVAAWLMRGVAGIGPDEGGPGYERIRFAPTPGGNLNHACASLETPRGRATIAWRLRDDEMVVDLTVPPTAIGHFEVPTGFINDGSPAEGTMTLGSGTHSLVLARAAAPMSEAGSGHDL
jgi:alpha-L-rhamnosidase